MEEAPYITGVDEDTDEEPQYKYNTTDVDTGQYEQQDEREDHEEYHNSH